MDNKASSVSPVHNAAIEVNLDKPQGWGLLEDRKNPAAHCWGCQRAPGSGGARNRSGSIKPIILLSKTDSYIQDSTSRNHITIKDKTVLRQSDLISNISHPSSNCE